MKTEAICTVKLCGFTRICLHISQIYKIGMEAGESFRGFRIFTFLKGKNMRSQSKLELQTQLAEVWRGMSTQEKNHYEAIAAAFLAFESSDPQQPSSRFLDLTKTLRRAKCRLNTFTKQLQKTKSNDSFCPVILPHDDMLTCTICSHGFDRAARQPLCLPCGHTFCELCVNQLALYGKFSCPMDRIQTEPAGLRVNAQMLEAIEKVLEAAKCRKHDAQVVAFDPLKKELLCGFCLASNPRAILLDSQEGVLLSTNHLAKCSEMTNKVLETLQYLYSSLYRCKLVTEQLSQPTKVPSAKVVLTRMRKFIFSLSTCTQILQAQAMHSIKLMSSTATLPSWQRLVLDVPAPPQHIPQFEELFQNCELWLQELREDSNLHV